MTGSNNAPCFDEKNLRGSPWSFVFSVVNFAER